MTDILAIGYSLYPGEGRDAFFDDAARNLFLGLTLYLCETPSLPRTMGELLRQSSGKGRPVKDHILNIIKERNCCELGDVMLNEVGEDRQKVVQAIVAATLIDKDKAETLCAQAPVLIAKDVPEAKIEHVEAILKGAGAQIETTRKSLPITQWDGIGLPPLSMECVDALSRFTSTSDNTLSSIMASFNVPITIWASPIVDAATSANDFDLRDIRKKLISIYIGIPANKLAEAKLLMNMFYTQLINLNTSRLLHSTPELRYTCLMLDDEFTAPGRIGIIDKANSYMAGYGLRMLNIIQSPGQLEADAPKGYGRENARTLVTNHACQIFFTPRDLRDANEYSEALGFYTFKAKGNSRQLGGKADGGRSESESDQKRALMMPQELKEMSQREQIVSLENTKAIRCEKIHYYSDPVFMDRLKSVSKTLANLGRGLPTKKQLESVWGSGELSVAIPLLNLDLHEAIVQDRSRELKANEVTKGIDLSTLAIDFSKIPYPSGDGIETAEVEAFVNGFFDALDLVNEYEDIGTAVIEKPAFDTGSTSEALPKNEMQATAFQDEEPVAHTEAESPAPSLIPALASASPLTETVKAVAENERGLDVADIEPAEASDEELTKMRDDFSFCADEIMGEAEMLAALDKIDEAPEYINDLQNRPIIDLSLLNKAFPASKDSITGQL